MLRQFLKCLLSVVMVAAVVLPAAQILNFRSLTGHWFPVRQVEKLENPFSVNGWTADGLLLEDGRVLLPPEVTALPTECAALSETIKHGIEISPQGEAYGLVKIHHWCGNDPVREHLTKVSLGDMLVFLGEAEPAIALGPDTKALQSEKWKAFTTRGWNISSFMEFRTWQQMRRMGLSGQ